MKARITIFVAFIAILSLASCGDGQGDGQQAQAMAQGQAVPVVTTKLPTRDISTYDRYSTSIEGINNSEARPKVSGYITQVLVDEGQRVKKGQVLFKLETESLGQDADAAKANINAAQVKVNQLKPLVEQDIVSKNELATAQAQLKQAQASYNSIIANIGYATVKSPTDGYVGKIRIRKGNLVGPSDPRALTTVSEIGKVYAYFSMNEKDYLNFLAVSPGKTKEEKIENMPEVILIMANGKEFPHKGKVQTINSQIGGSGTVSFRAVFDNPEHILTNGSTGEIHIPKVYNDVLIVPENATFSIQDKTYVVKIEQQEGKKVAVSQPIDIVDEVRNYFIVDGGVKEGDEIIAKGANSITSGTPVKPNLQPFDSIAKPVTPLFEQ